MIIRFTINQLIWIGLHVGHTAKQSAFLAAWAFYGWRYNLFIHDMVKSIMMIKVSLSTIRHSIIRRRPIWYIAIKHVSLGALIVRYSYIVGESFCSYNWIAGSVTNFKRIWGWNNLLVRISSSVKYNSRFKDKKKLLSFVGMLFTRKRIPGMGFVPRPLEDRIPTDEFLLSSIPCVNIADSNCSSSNLIIPIVGNDDSFICLNFITFLLTKNILLSKSNNLKKWRLIRYSKLRNVQLNKKFLFLKLLQKFYVKREKNFDFFFKKNQNYFKFKPEYLTNYEKIFKYEQTTSIQLSYWRYVETMVPDIVITL